MPAVDNLRFICLFVIKKPPPVLLASVNKERLRYLHAGKRAAGLRNIHKNFLHLSPIRLGTTPIPG
jgi:hypothetical protein